MSNHLNEIHQEIKALGKSVQEEIRRKEKEFQYKIRKRKIIFEVKRLEHIVLDRHFLRYRNVIERLNCHYCSYFNGLASYSSEIGARTEQYWCPIKHASGKARLHSRYHHFADYGDAEAYRSRLSELRGKFEDAE